MHSDATPANKPIQSGPKKGKETEAAGYIDCEAIQVQRSEQFNAKVKAYILKSLWRGEINSPDREKGKKSPKEVLD